MLLEQLFDLLRRRDALFANIVEAEIDSSEFLGRRAIGLGLDPRVDFTRKLS